MIGLVRAERAHVRKVLVIYALLVTLVLAVPAWLAQRRDRSAHLMDGSAKEEAHALRQ